MMKQGNLVARDLPPTGSEATPPPEEKTLPVNYIFFFYSKNLVFLEMFEIA